MIDWLTFALFIATLIIGGNLRKASKEASYLLAERKVGLISLTATLVMTEFNTSTLLAFSAMGYLFGLPALAFPAIFLIALLFYAFAVAKKWKAFDGYSVAGLFTERYGQAIGLVASLSLLVAMGCFSANYVKSLTLLFAPLLPPLSPWALSAALILAVLTLTVRGGLMAIITTDLLSFIAMIAFFIGAFFLRGHSPPPSQGGVLPWELVISLTVLSMFTYILAPWYAQKIFSARSQRTAFTATLLSSLLVFAFYGIAIVLTASVRAGSVSEAEMAFPYFIHRLPGALRGFGYGVLFAASATTLTGVWNAMVAMLVGDFLGTRVSARRSQWLTVGIAFVSYLLANLLIDQIFPKLILANIPIAALSFALLAGFYWKGATRLGALVSIVVGLAWGVGCYTYLGEEGGYTWAWAIYGIPLIFASGIAVSLLGRQAVSANASAL